jgi:low affinity Fe/Cu permease
VKTVDNRRTGSGHAATHAWFPTFARHLAAWSGRSIAFFLALSLVVVWVLTGPYFGYSDTWQLVINTATTIITFLMVFLIQNTQNRDSHALHLKLDELIRANTSARNRLMGLEKLTDAELDELEGEFAALAKEKLAARDSAPAAPSSGSRDRQQPGASKTSSSTTGARSSRAT